MFRIPPQVIFHKNRKHVRCGSVELSWKCFGPISPTDQDESHYEPRTKSPQREAFRVRERRVDGGRERRIETRRQRDVKREREREHSGSLIWGDNPSLFTTVSNPIQEPHQKQFPQTGF